MKVYQIYFKESQIDQLEPGYIPFFNEYCTRYFESQVIHDLVKQGAHIGEAYFGVVSYKLRQKLGYMKENWKNNKNIVNTSVTEFTPEQFEIELYKHKPDAMSFQRHVPHDPIIVADNFHPGFRKYWTYIMDKIGYRWVPTRFENVFYCNYFVATTFQYERYVNEMLAPAMKVMSEMPELDNRCNYPQPFPEHLKGKFGVDHWTYHAFICERFFSYFAHIHKLDCKHY
jgi:hypothetical protein